MDETTQAGGQQGDAGAPDPLTRLGLALFGWLSAMLLRLLGASWRFEVLGDDPREGDPPMAQAPHLAAIYHESMLPALWTFRDRRYGVAVSRSRDGDLIRRSLLRLGYAEPARGSSSRGASAVLRRIVRQLEEGTTVAVLVDGPRGPARRAKTGIVSIARLAERPIQPVAFAARPALRLGSWDGSLIPLPFARVVCAFGDPLTSGSDPDEAHEQAMARELDRRLARLHAEADGAVGRPAGAAPDTPG
ncbi:MAG: lysophospholipid acyltransferase family protein [Deltaproteobacteria bacterium]|jgi:lysophospholipid acyltransferase (LPLAT)-like uncharacterized protein|nr:lysophospholipid acyltransferase family protein [Deltaproteobacteria bacterium]MBW2497789.1 lysophospholipid acyltransferase family protein [Deltaproteobacteria bacterium]